MTLTVLRSKSNEGADEMIKFVRYNFGGGSQEDAENDHGSVEAGAEGGSNP